VAFAGTAAAVLAFVGIGARADAHAELVSSEPAAGSQLDTAPDRVVLEFTEAVELTEDTVRVLDAEGRRIAIGDPEHPDGAGDAVAASLPGDLGDGAYVVAWRVVSSDSHPIGGAFTFRVGEAGAAAVDDQALIDDVLGGERQGDATLGAVFGVVRFAGFAGVIVLAGAAVFIAWLWPAGAADRRARRLVGAAWVTAVVATALSIPLQGAYVAAGTLADALGVDVIADELGARTGQAWVLRLVLLALAAVALPRLAREPGGTEARAASVVGGVALAVTVSLTGHAVSGDLVPIAFVADLVHLSGAGVWLGGLALLAYAVLRPSGDAAPGAARDGGGDPATNDDGDSSHGDGDGGVGAGSDAIAGVVSQFSTVAFAAVVALAASGTLQGWRQVGGYDALLETTYGRLLVIKVALVGGMLVAAAFSRSWVRQRAGIRAATAALSPGPGAVAAGTTTGGPPLSVLRQSVGAEAALAVAVLAVTALLVNAVPGGTAGGGGGGPFATQLTEDDIVLGIDVDPAAVGPVDVHLFLNEIDGAPVVAEEVTAELALPERDLGPITLSLVDFGQGHLSADGAEIPLEGDWDLEVTVRTSDIDQTVFETVVPVT
jgi:copper transport protein